MQNTTNETGAAAPGLLRKRRDVVRRDRIRLQRSAA